MSTNAYKTFPGCKLGKLGYSALKDMVLSSFPTATGGDSSELGGGNLNLKPRFTECPSEIEEVGGSISQV